MRPVYQKIVAATFIVACSFFASAHQSFAFGLSPPEVSIAQTLSATSSVSESVGLQRGEGEVGSLVFSVGFHGECAGCIQGANTVVMGPGQDSVEYDFTVAPAGASAGSYRQYIAFLLETVSSDGDASGNAVQRGVTATVKFTVTGESSDGGGSSGGGGGGSGGGGSGSTDTGTTEPSTDTTSPTDTTDAADTADTTDATNGTEPPGDGVGATAIKVPAEPEPVALFPYPPAGDWQDEIVAPVEPTVPAAPVSEVPVPTVFSFDQNADAIIDGSDFAAFVDAYFSGSCSAACDANGDGASDLSDVVLLSGRISSEGRTEAVPPVMPGPPLAEDMVRLYFEKGSEVGHYQFSTVAAEVKQEDLVTFYLLADTGPNGIRAGDVAFQFDPGAMTFVGVSRVGSIFPYLRGSFASDGAGTIRFVGVTDDPFVGTRGYVAAFQFRPIREGRTTLAFGAADTIDGARGIPAVVTTVNLSGALATRLSVAGNGGEALSVPVPSERAPCPCLTRKQFPICLLLAGALATAIVAAVALVAGKRVDETDNPALPIE